MSSDNKEQSIEAAAAHIVGHNSKRISPQLTTVSSANYSNDDDNHTSSADDRLHCVVSDSVLHLLFKDSGKSCGELDAEVSNEIEITIPSGLMRADFCELCQAPFNCDESAKTHYMGRRHAQNESQYVRKIYISKKDINQHKSLKRKSSTSSNESSKKFVKAEPKVADAFQKDVERCLKDIEFLKTSDQAEIRKPGIVDIALDNLGKACNETIEQASVANVDSNCTKDPGNVAVVVDSFYCHICTRSMNSAQQLNEHFASKKHKSKERTAS